jgi:hypothetical protein
MSKHSLEKMAKSRQIGVN